VNGVELAEQLFHVDSAVAADLAPLALELGEPEHDWLLAAVGMHRLLAASRWDDHGRHDLVAEIARRYQREHGADDRVLHRLGELYRVTAATFAAWLDGTSEHALAREAHARWDAATPRVAAILDTLYAIHARGEVAAGLESLFASYLHLGACRVLPRALRETELVIHDFLRRYYRSKIARARPRPRGGH
jgi:thiopeptide-type bacteriocin biosynthesis protein